VLTRIGDFYEASGMDAVLLVEHAGLNAMAPGSGIPRAGCPKDNIRRTLDCLVGQAGLSVVSGEGGGRGAAAWLLLGARLASWPTGWLAAVEAAAG
jgi:hypothetical protein